MMDISMKYVLLKIKLPATAFCKIFNNKFCYLVKVCLYAAVVTCTANTKMLAMSNDLTNSIELEVRQQQSIGTENSGLDDFYNPDQTQSIHLRVKASDRQKMFDALPERIYVPASFQWRDTLIDQVAIRFKGNSSSRPNQLHKRSFLIKFNKYNEAQRFLGLRRVSLDNGVQFGSLFSEPIITEILRQEGITVHRSNYAKLYLNDEYQGVYVNVERLDKSFLEYHWPGTDGALWKVDLGGPGSNLQFMGKNPAAYHQAFEAKNNLAKKNTGKLVDFIRLINQAKQPEFTTQLKARLALDEFMRVTAILLFAGAFDQLTGWNPHNYYLYHDLKQERWHYLPWDLDVGFCEIAFGQIYVIEDWHAAWPVPGATNNPLLEAIIADVELLAAYRQSAKEILDKYFEPERLSKIIDAKYARIKSDLQTDPFPHRRATVPSDSSYDDVVASIKAFVYKRYTTALQQLENPGQRPKSIPRPSRHHHPNLTPQLARRIEAVMQGVQQTQRDVTAIRDLMQQVGPLVEARKLDQAEGFIEKAEDVLKRTKKNAADRK